MIQYYSSKKRIDLLFFVKNNFNEDFYVTINNKRKFVVNSETLNLFLKNSFNVLLNYENGDINGVIGVWKSNGANIERSYVKLLASNYKVAYKLLSVLLWNTKRELFVKIKKNSSFLSLFKEKGFKFFGDRGSEILLKRDKVEEISKKEKENVSKSFVN